MKRQVYLENWQDELITTISYLAERVIWMSDSVEKDALNSDWMSLQEMRREVQQVRPKDRKLSNSLVMRLQVESPLNLPPDLISRIGQLFEVYRRFRTRLSWRDNLHM
jgi:hypothetical protein